MGDNKTAAAVAAVAMPSTKYFYPLGLIQLQWVRVGQVQQHQRWAAQARLVLLGQFWLRLAAVAVAQRKTAQPAVAVAVAVLMGQPPREGRLPALRDVRAHQVKALHRDHE